MKPHKYKLIVRNPSKMSQTFTLTGSGGSISVDYFPPIELNPDYEYILGLIGFYGCNSIRNIYEGNNKLHYNDKVIVIPSGAYEINELNTFIKTTLGDKFNLWANNNTLKCGVFSSYTINFNESGSIGRMLGFSKQKLKAGVRHESDLDVQIVKSTDIHVECNLTSGAYRNNNSVHTIFEFDLSVEPGYRLIKEPSHIIYLPVTSNVIHNITLKLVDQHGDAVDFGTEPFTIRLELKQNGIKHRYDYK